MSPYGRNLGCTTEGVFISNVRLGRSSLPLRQAAPALSETAGWSVSQGDSWHAADMGTEESLWPYTVDSRVCRGGGADRRAALGQ